MGKYFTHDELTRRAIPHPSGFAIVLEKLEEITRDWECVVHAGIIGSTIRDRASSREIGGNARSDIDCILITDSTSPPERTSRILRLAHERAHVFFVPLETHVFSLSEAQGTGHSFGPGFVRHVLAHVRGAGNLKGDFAGCFTYHTLDAAAEAHQYVTRKHAALTRRGFHLGFMTPAEEAHHLGKLADAPFHAARRVLDARGIRGENDGKKEILALYGKHIDSETGFNTLSHVVALDQQYTRFVEWIRDLERNPLGFDLFETAFTAFRKKFLALQLEVPDFLEACVRHIGAPNSLISCE